jgi:hypothetical protein
VLVLNPFSTMPLPDGILPWLAAKMDVNGTVVFPA